MPVSHAGVTPSAAFPATGGFPWSSCWRWRLRARTGRLEDELRAAAADGKRLRGVGDGPVKPFAAMPHEEKVMAGQVRVFMLPSATSPSACSASRESPRSSAPLRPPAATPSVS